MKVFLKKYGAYVKHIGLRDGRTFSDRIPDTDICCPEDYIAFRIPTFVSDKGEYIDFIKKSDIVFVATLIPENEIATRN